jgi:hypothetical protein
MLTDTALTGDLETGLPNAHAGDAPKAGAPLMRDVVIRCQERHYTTI